VMSYKVDGISGSVERILCGALEGLDGNGITWTEHYVSRDISLLIDIAEA